MISTPLQKVASSVVRRAQRQGFVVPGEVRQELVQAGAPELLWKDVLALARPALSYRHGRYYYAAASAAIHREQQQQRRIHQSVRLLIRQHRASARSGERRSQDRIDFIQPVQVETEDERRFTLLSRDLSVSGIRLIGTRRLLGQKVRVRLPHPQTTPPAEGAAEEGGSLCFVVRILWTCAVGDDLFENGGQFLSVETES